MITPCPARRYSLYTGVIMQISYLVNVYNCDAANLDRLLQISEVEYTAVAFILFYIAVMITRWQHVAKAESVIESDRSVNF